MLNPIQEKLLNMLSWFHDYCVQNNITYYAAGGTVIGAARHNGFIPWDDDIDIVVPRLDYNRLINTFTEKIDHFYLESPYSGNPDFLYSYAKLYDTNTTLIERTYKKCRRGIYIDVFPLDSIGLSQKEAIQNYKKVDRKNMLLMTRTCVVRRERKWYKNASILLSKCIPSFLINDKKLSMELDKLADSLNIKESVYVANLMGAYREKEIVKCEMFGNPVLHLFESIYIFLPEKYEDYLRSIYGNWRELPPIEKRKTQHDFVEIDLNKSYTK